ncbi:hypothetical protein ACIOD2_32145 [Amycolatopsis sp. NPDC088138]|uniref:hypothetical protein n=1 Tax=Amycolatopsis sp. NPDC088138 TaxID=3363938 RepID=UPI0038130422
MAQLPSEQFLMQQIGPDVVLFDRYTEDEIVRYPVADQDATAKAQHKIATSSLGEEDRCFAHFWAGYFWAHGGVA